MYINELNYNNVGPIENLNIKFRKNDENTPVPVILVGKNGSGKSILLSNIIDAFYEIADKRYNNVTKKEGVGHKYYKPILPMHKKIGTEYLVAHIMFQQDAYNFEYLFKTGKISFEDYSKLSALSLSENLNWGNEDNYKDVTVEKNIVKDIFEKEVVCFFSPNRYTKPDWMGDKYYDENEIGSFSNEANYSDILKTAIIAKNITDETLQWLFDVVADSKLEIKKVGNELAAIYPNRNDIDNLLSAKENIEKIMSLILEEDVNFRMLTRSWGRWRFSICTPEGVQLVPSLDSLSTGQMAIFNMFATIIRYADKYNIELGVKIEDIKGIVVIDEIELHLHAYLQREILPKLIKLFPNVQFIITSHSPLFLLGMKEVFGEENFDVYEMPNGNRISVEQFSEFENAYRYFADTNKYRNEIKNAINSKQDRTLVITEGTTDWKHLKAAYNLLLSDARCSDWLPLLDFEFLEYEPANSLVKGEYNLEMGADNLKNMCLQYKVLEQNRKMIFIADCDKPNITACLGSSKPYVNWGNNVYSMCLPVPEFRQDTPLICIEHLYTDNDLKKEIIADDGLPRRLFMGNEFNNKGVSVGDLRFLCDDRNCCGENKINIIDGNDKKKVTKPWSENSDRNYALSKMDFADKVLNKTAPFDEMDFSGFISVFETIRDIMNNN